MSPKLNGDQSKDDKKMPKFLIGSQEWCAFPELGIPAILARVDSGARTSSLHAFNIQPIQRQGQPWVSFEVHPLQRNRRLVVCCEAPVHDLRNVKSSSGFAEERYVIQTTFRLWDHEIAIELTLANRDSMGYRMLLGREAMVGRMLVDPALSCHLGEISEVALKQHYQNAHRSSEGLRVGMLKSSGKDYTNDRLIEAIEERGHFVTTMAVSRFFFTTGSNGGQIIQRKRGPLSMLDGLLARWKPTDHAHSIRLLSQYKSLGGATINSVEGEVLCSDTSRLLQGLQAEGIVIWRCGFTSQSCDIGELVARLGGEPCLARIEHTQGGDNRGIPGQQRDFVVLESPHETRQLQIAWQSQSGAIQVVGQAQLTKGRIRVLVIGGKIVASLVQSGDWFGQSEPTLQNAFEPIVLTKDEKKIAIKVAKFLNFAYVAIDFVRSKGEEAELMVSDVESAPDLELFESLTNKDFASLVIFEIERVCDWRTQVPIQQIEP